MRIRLIAAGTRLPSWIDEGCEDYARRFGRGLKFELVEVPLLRTAERMRAALGARDYVVALEVKGRSLSTPELAEWLAARMAGGRDLALLVGGPDGLDAIALVHRLCGAHVPALLITGDTSPDEMQRMVDSGHPVLFKPVQPRRLYDALHDQIG